MPTIANYEPSSPFVVEAGGSASEGGAATLSAADASGASSAELPAVGPALALRFPEEEEERDSGRADCSAI